MVVMAVLLLALTACGRTDQGKQEKSTDISSHLTYEDSMELAYAEKF